MALLPSNMENENLITSEDDWFQREERCRKTIKTVVKAVFMRLLVTVILVWGLLQSSMELWVWGLMAFVLVINLSGILPLGSELKKRRAELKEILAEEE